MRRPHGYQEGCPDCKPAILDIETGKPLPDDHPTMKKVMEMWHKASFIEKSAFIEVTLNNSRVPGHLDIAMRFINDIERACAKSN